jgi:hypothetical protein
LTAWLQLATAGERILIRNGDILLELRPTSDYGDGRRNSTSSPPAVLPELLAGGHPAAAPRPFPRFVPTKPQPPP